MNKVLVYLSRLVAIAAACYQAAAAITGFFNPKIFFDFATTRLDLAVSPIPFLQMANLLSSVLVLLFEWPGPVLVIHRSFYARLTVLAIAAILALLLHQATNAALYYLIGIALHIHVWWNVGDWSVHVCPRL